MPELIAKGSDAAQHWRRPLIAGELVRLGRAPAHGWSVPWDSQISREHVELIWRGAQLEVHSLETARNPVFYLGQPVTDFAIEPGEHFVIGLTSFQVVEDTADDEMFARLNGKISYRLSQVKDGISRRFERMHL